MSFFQTIEDEEKDFSQFVTFTVVHHVVLVEPALEDLYWELTDYFLWMVCELSILIQLVS